MTNRCNWLLVFVVSFCCAVNLNAVRIFLKDDRGVSGLSKDWSFSSYNDSYSCSNSWSKNEVNKLITYTTCLPASDIIQQYCVLKSSVYSLNDANIVFINVTLSTKTCQSFPKLEPKCYNYFTLSVRTIGNELGVNKALNLPGISVPSDYKGEFYLSNDLIVSDATGKSEIELKLFTRNYCGELLDVSLFYYKCPNATNELVIFPYIAAPSKNDSPIMIWGNCSKNAISPVATTPFMKCYFNGSFSVSGACQCKEGYEKKELSCKGLIDNKNDNSNNNNKNWCGKSLPKDSFRKIIQFMSTA